MINKKNFTAALFLILISIPFLFMVYAYTSGYKILQEMGPVKQPLPTRIYDRNGTLISMLYDEYREYAPIEEIPDTLKKAFITAEDSSFYHHTGFNIMGIMRALVVDMASGELKQGGSTITQQLAKQLYTDRERSFRRKAVELFIARELERKYSKDRILELYLNQIYFGHGIYGVKSAAAFFLSKELQDINIAEAALLASIPSAPNRFSPFRSPALSRERSMNIMFNIAASGYIPKNEAAEIFTRFWDSYSQINITKKAADSAPWVTEHIRRELIKKYGEEKVYRGGLEVSTTIDINHQKAAEKVMAEALTAQNRITAPYNSRLISAGKISLSGADSVKKHKFAGELENSLIHELNLISLITGADAVNAKLSPALENYDNIIKSSRAQGALIAIDPESGGIRAMVGGAGFSSKNQLNRAIQSRRQPGSAFKIFVYGAAIDEGKITPASQFFDAPVTYRSRKETWSPSNYGKDFTGLVLARRALALSLNVVPARIYTITGGESIAKFASKTSGLQYSKFEIDPTLSLGTTELTPLEMTRGIAAYANGGISVTPHAIIEIKDPDGTVIYTRQKKRGARVMKEETAYIMTSMLKEVVDSGTASYAVKRAAGFTLPCAGKTGTNTSFRDAWFTGFTRDIAATVWVGCDSPEFTLGPGQSGSTAAAPVWGRFMKEVYKTGKYTRFPKQPKGIVSKRICTVTGKLAEKGCPVRNEYFIKRTEPSEKCNTLHGKITNIKELIKSSRGKKSASTTELFRKDEKEPEKTVETHYFY
jgi:penicillin-binding protein 1A